MEKKKEKKGSRKQEKEGRARSMRGQADETRHNR